MSRSRRWFGALALFALVLSACSEPADTGDDGNGGTTAPTATDGGGGACENVTTKEEGRLIVGAEYPYYAPFLEGEEGDPTGFEADIVYYIADHMGFSEDDVEWLSVPFTGLFAPGEKPFDFDINEITITEERDQVVDFSDPYFDANQGLLVREGEPIAEATTLDELKQYTFAAQANTTGLAYIEDTIQPDEDPQIFDDLSAAGEALAVGQVDAVIIDVPIAIGMTGQFEGTTVSGQFLTNEQYGILFEEGSPLIGCVNEAIAAMKDDGTLEDLQEEYFPGSTDLPVIE